MTLEEAGKKALKYANRYSAGGFILAGRRTADYNNKLNALANDAQQELARIAKISAEFKFTQNFINPVASSGFAIKQYGKNTTGDIILVSGTEILAYSFKADTDKFSVVIEEETSTDVWVPIAAVTSIEDFAGITEVPAVVDDGGFKEYKYKVTPSVSSNGVRMRCTGSYPFNIKDYALWDELFYSDDVIPPYSKIIEYDLPNNFMELNETMQIGKNDRWLLNQVQFDKENNKIYIRRDLIGEFRIFYYRTPTEIDEDTLTSYVFELTNTLALSAIPYYIAGVMIAEDIGDMSNFCMQRYEILKEQIEATKTVQNNVKQVENSMWRRRGEWYGR